MNEIIVLTKRTMKLYLKNPLSLLFSFIYMLLFIVLIAMFLGDYLTKGMTDVYAEVKGIDFNAIQWLVNTISMSGVIMINCILVPLNVLQVMVDDMDSNRLVSFLVSSAKREQLVLGYWLAPFIIGIVMNSIGLIISEAFIVSLGGHWLSFGTNFSMFGLIVVNTFSATSLLFVVAQLIQRTSVYSTFSGLMSTVVGFVTGAFLPIGVFPDWIQKIMIVVPAHSGATMMRQTMTAAPLRAVFKHVPNQTISGTKMSAAEIIAVYTRENGITYFFGKTEVSFLMMLVIVLLSGIVFSVISVLLMKRQRK